MATHIEAVVQRFKWYGFEVLVDGREISIVGEPNGPHLLYHQLTENLHTFSVKFRDIEEYGNNSVVGLIAGQVFKERRKELKERLRNCTGYFKNMQIGSFGGDRCLFLSNRYDSDEKEFEDIMFHGFDQYFVKDQLFDSLEGAVKYAKILSLQEML